MKRSFLIVAMLLAAAPLSAQRPSTFKGRSTCEQSLLNPPGSYGVRLDASQNAYLQVRRFNGRYVLFIVKSEREDESCGRIVDVVQAPRRGDYFVFDCENLSSPADVVVGLWPYKRKSTSGLAMAAWKIDLRHLQLVPLHVPIQCVLRGLSGSDEGSDLRSDAQRRASASRSHHQQPKNDKQK
jgi:hypothetical protein